MTNAKKTTAKKVVKKATTTAKKTAQTGGKATKVTAKKIEPTAKTVTKKAQTGGAKAKTVTKTVVKTTAKAKTVQTGGKKTTTRYFKVIVNGEEPRGRFSGSKPKQAANKALTSILREREGNNDSTNGQIKFSIVECTRGSRCKEYSYVGERVELEEPMEVKIGNKLISYRYNNKVSKDKQTNK